MTTDLHAAKQAAITAWEQARDAMDDIQRLQDELDAARRRFETYMAECRLLRDEYDNKVKLADLLESRERKEDG